MSYRDLYVSADDWYLEVQYVDGDRWYVTSPNPEELADIRDRTREAIGDRIVSAVIARTTKAAVAKAYAEANDLPVVEITTTELGGTIMELSGAGPEFFEVLDSLSPSYDAIIVDDPCVRATEHVLGTDHRWQECPTYHK